MNNTINQIDHSLKNMSVSLDSLKKSMSDLDHSMGNFCLAGNKIVQSCSFMATEGFGNLTLMINNAEGALLNFAQIQSDFNSAIAEGQPGIDTMNSGITNISGNMSSLGSFIKDTLGPINTLFSFIKNINEVKKSWIIISGVLARVIKNPIVIAISGIISLYKNVDSFRNIVDKTAISVKNFADKALTKLHDFGTSAGSFAENFLNGTSKFISYINDWQKSIKGNGKDNPFLTWMANGLETLSGKITPAIEKEYKKMASLYKLIGIGNEGEEIQDIGTDKLTGTQNALERFIEDYTHILNEQDKTLQNQIQEVSGSVSENLPAKIAPVLEPLQIPSIPEIEVPPINIPVQINKDDFAKVEEVIEKGVKKSCEVKFDFGKQVTQGIASIAESLGTAIGSGDWSASFQSMLIGLIDMLKVFGEALIAAGAAGIAFKTLMANPILAIVAGTALVAASAIAKSALQKTASPMANGGIAYGTTYAMVGEYPGAANNPEVIAPLNKLKQLIQPQDTGGGIYEFRLRGRDFVAVADKQRRINSRTR